MEFFPGIDPARDLPGGKGWAVEFVTLSTHSGTHLDAPWHYHPTMDGGWRSPSTRSPWNGAWAGGEAGLPPLSRTATR